jgi:hypothetical protein
VRELRVGTRGRPLVFHRGGYTGLVAA